jgi:hypothetical protein
MSELAAIIAGIKDCVHNKPSGTVELTANLARNLLYALEQHEASNKALTEKLEAAEEESRRLMRAINDEISGPVYMGEPVLAKGVEYRLRMLDKEGYKPTTGAIGEEAAATIESLNLRVARLVDALKFYADGSHFVQHQDVWESVSGEPDNFLEDENNTATVEDGFVARYALIAEGDNEWLMEHDAKVIESTYRMSAADKSQHISELRQPKKSPETDLDQAMRIS